MAIETFNTYQIKMTNILVGEKVTDGKANYFLVRRTHPIPNSNLEGFIEGMDLPSILGLLLTTSFLSRHIRTDDNIRVYE
jgi:hypothetical protein